MIPLLAIVKHASKNCMLLLEIMKTETIRNEYNVSFEHFISDILQL